MDCKDCPWKRPEACKVCVQDEAKLEDYSLYYLTKILCN